MKSTNAKICILIAVFGLMMTFSACNKSKDPGPAIVKFTLKQDTYNEDEGTANIEVSISRKLSKDVVVDYTWSGSSTTYWNGDFSADPSGTVTIAAGQTFANIQVDIIDDTQIDENDEITLTLTSVTNAKLSSTSADVNFDLTIQNNDNLFANTLQADLTWDTGVGQDINNVDLDLNLQQDVVFDGSNINNPGTTYLFSQNSTGFESLLVIASDPDQEYWFEIPYFDGSGAVDFTLTLNGFGWTNGTITRTLNAAGDVYFVGPFIKNGNTFPQGRSISLGNGKLLTIQTQANMPMKKRHK